MTKGFTISEVARQVGLRPSAIRYYEQIGILLPPQRINGQRRYDPSVLGRIGVIQRARETGFSLNEVRQLFFGFQNGALPSSRWKKLSQRKLTELDDMRSKIQTMQDLLRRMMQNCNCDTLDECGRKLLLKRSSFEGHQNKAGK